MSSGPSWEWEAKVGVAGLTLSAWDEDRLSPLLLAGRNSMLGPAQQNPRLALTVCDSHKHNSPSAEAAYVFRALYLLLSASPTTIAM